MKYTTSCHDKETRVPPRLLYVDIYRNTAEVYLNLIFRFFFATVFSPVADLLFTRIDVSYSTILYECWNPSTPTTYKYIHYILYV